MIALCDEFMCDGCQCHRSPPCHHCVDHVMERVVVHRTAKGWQYSCPICVIPEWIGMEWGRAVENAHTHVENHMAAVRGVDSYRGYV